MGEMIKNIHTYIVPNSEPFTLTTEWEYDSWNRVKQIIYPDKETVTYTYNLGGLLKHVEGNKPSIGQTIYIDSIVYDKYEQRTAVYNGNQTRTYYTYDTIMRRMTNLKTEHTWYVLLDIQYDYDPIGNITKIENTGLSPYVQNYTYDNNNQLSHADGNYGGQVGYDLTMQYSPSGRIENKKLRGDRIDNNGTYPINYDNTYRYGVNNNPYALKHIIDNKTGQEHYFNWDVKGNMIFHDDKKNGNPRRLCWTEDNRIQAMSDKNNGAWYNYDATGERNLKLTGQTMHVNQNGQDYYTPIFDQQTLYANPLITINDKGYTKHYFEEGKRICSKIGSGGLIIDKKIEGISQGIEEIRDIQKDGLVKTFDICMQLHPYIKTNNLHKTVVKPYEGQINPGEPIFYYHSDHLGSASFLTDTNGIETQELVYLPFGEDWVDMKYNTQQYDTPYKFNGKEKDEETGYNNYGARYYYDWASIWLSVDPMSDKYPNLTSYNYCANNPVMLIDPDGREIGDYYDSDSRYLGNDGIDDNKVYKLQEKYCANYENTDVNWGGTLSKEHYTELQSKSNDLGTVQEAFVTGDGVSDKRIQNLHPSIRMLTTDFINEANASSKGTKIRVAQGFRSYAEQDALYAQGRTSPGNIVTKAKGGFSNHNFGLAFDIVGITNGKVDYNLDWNSLSKLGKSKGFNWGGDWKFKDNPHFENMFGNNMKSLRALPKDKNGLPILKK